MKQVYFAFGLVLIITLLAGCGAAGSAETTAAQATEAVALTEPAAAAPMVEPAPVETIQPSDAAGASGAESAATETGSPSPLGSREDTQGAVEVTVTPLFGASTSTTLDFKIILDTHSVDLTFDLAKLAELKTDTGVTLLPVKWDAPSGGHHVEGVLSFPAEVDGKPALAGAGQIILTIKEVDAPLRTFTWDLAP